jgi:putative peptide zinc metalloprotease protein
VAILAAVLFVPLPYYVVCPLHVQPRDATAVYIDSPGRVREVFLRGGRVEAGQPIMQLENEELLVAHQQLASQHERLAARLDSIRQRATSDETALLELAHTQEAYDALTTQLARHQAEIDRLTIRAPRGGVLVPPMSRPRSAESRIQLASWSGRPWDARNRGAWLEQSTIVCRIAQPGQWEALLALPQQEAEFVHGGQTVDIVLDHQPSRKFAGEIAQTSQQQLEAAPLSLSTKGGGPLATRTDANGLERPIDTTYQASVALDEHDILVAGGTGWAKIHAGHQSLGRRLWRTLCHTFRFEM